MGQDGGICMKRMLLNHLMAIGGENISEDEYSILIDLINEIDEGKSSTIQELAKRNYVSPATVTRLCKKFGYGFREMKQNLKSEMKLLHQKTTEAQVNPNFHISELHHFLNDNITRTFDKIDDHDLTMTIERLKEASNIVVISNGLSQIAGDYFSQRLSIIGKTATNMDIGLSAGIFVNQLSKADLVIVISRSGQSPLLKNKLNIAKKLKKTIVSIGCEKNSPFGQIADHCLPIYGFKQSFDQSNQVTMYNLSVFFLIDVIIKNLLEQLVII